MSQDENKISDQIDAGIQRQNELIQLISPETLTEILIERENQVHKWGPEDDNPPVAWGNIIGKQFGQLNQGILQAAQSQSKEDFDDGMALYRKKLVQIAAVCFAAIEEYNIKTKK